VAEGDVESYGLEECDDGAVDAGLEQLDGGGVPQDVWGDALCFERRAVGSRSVGVLVYEALDGVAAELATPPTRKHNVVALSILFTEPVT